ncbi:MAG TPA: TetR/AcrR family transcriptional regulator [Solirubrobacteraceae bacterium]|nr:TetR/AcrR family transcriptional regulator [Solirubrobacteraceae bacterium]
MRPDAQTDDLDDGLRGGDPMDRVLEAELGPEVADVFIRMRRTQDEWELRRHPDLGLRERKKRFTRRRISDVATTLFVAKGFENVTVAKVADVVGVSEKTVYNYFPTKESLVFDDADEGVARLATALRESPRGEPPTSIMLRALTADIDRFAAVPDDAAVFLPLFADMVAATPSLRAAWLDIYGRLLDVATRELAGRAEVDPDEPEVIIAARALVGLHDVSYASLVRHARAGVRGVELRDAALADIERAARLLDTGLWSLNLLAQGFGGGQQQLRGAARAAEEARRQVLSALRQARSTWADLRRQVADQAGAGGPTDRDRQAERGDDLSADRAGRGPSRGRPPGSGRGRPAGSGRGGPPLRGSGPARPR